MMITRACSFAVCLLALHAGFGQAAPAAKPVPAAARPQAKPDAASPAEPVVPTDPIVDAAERLVGEALILRGFPAANDLAYDAAGKLESTPKTGDWTLAAINVTKVARHSATEVELDGLRVAIRYNPDAHEFQRHPLNDEKMKLLVKVAAGDAGVKQLRSALSAIFSIGIDPALQRSMPSAWRHYFDPSVPWPADDLAGQSIYAMYGLPDQPKDVAPPVLAHKTDASFTPYAQRDKVKGAVQLRMVVDAEGIPQRIAVTRPIGYGLDEKAAEAIAKWRFTPATRGGKPVASGIVVNLDFEYVQPAG